jgi:uncharacterized protein
MEVKQVIPPGRQIIERYGPGGFHISGVTFTGPVLIFPDETRVWDIAGIADLGLENLRPAAEHGGVEILLLGTGKRMLLIPKELRSALRAVGIVIETMDTGAACRTYGVLLAEERRVAAALLPLRD